VTHDVAEAFPELDEQMPPLDLSVGFRSAGADRGSEGARDDEAERVHEHCVRSGDERDQSASQARPGDLRSRLRDVQLRVALDQMVAIHDLGEVRLIGDVEENRVDPDEEADDVQLGEREVAGGVHDRDREEKRGPAEVADDEHRATLQPVDPYASGEREEQEGQELDRLERRHLERRRIEGHERHPRDRELRNLRAELADRLTGPELQEVPV
jgi:hypothetical protein